MQNDKFFEAHYLVNPTKFGLAVLGIIQSNIFKFLKMKFDLKGKKMLELGPADGTLADHFIRYGVDYHAMEASQKFSQVLAEKAGKDKIVTGKCPPIHFPDNYFDIVVLFNLLEHMPTADDAILLIQEIRRVLKSDGIIVIGIPSILHWKFYFFEADYTHNFVTSQRRINQLLLDNNFSFIGSKSYSLLFNFLDRIIHFMFYYFPAGFFPEPFKERAANFKFTLLLKTIIMGKKNS